MGNLARFLLGVGLGFGAGYAVCLLKNQPAAQTDAKRPTETPEATPSTGT